MIFRVYGICKKELDSVCIEDKFVKRTCAMLRINKQTPQRILSEFDKSARTTSETNEKVCSDKTKGNLDLFLQGIRFQKV